MSQAHIRVSSRITSHRMHTPHESRQSRNDRGGCVTVFLKNRGSCVTVFLRVEVGGRREGDYRWEREKEWGEMEGGVSRERYREAGRRREIERERENFTGRGRSGFRTVLIRLLARSKLVTDEKSDRTPKGRSGNL
jgi:hypothetical protein